MKRIVLRLLVAVNLLSCLSVSLAEDRLVPITFSVTNTGINRFIASQWGSSSFTKTRNFSYQGVFGTVQIYKPTVSLYSNTIKICIPVTILAIDESTDQPIYLYQSFQFIPTLTIPPTTISMDKIYTQYTDLLAAISAVIPDTRVRGAVAQMFSSINWVIYQGKVLNESTARWTESSDIGWKGLPTLTFSVANDEVNLTITPTIYSHSPSYSFEWIRISKTDFKMRVYSNNQFLLDLTNNKLTLLNGTAYSVTINSTLPIQATYDASKQKYVALLEYTAASNIVMGLGWVNIKLKIDRANVETLWSFWFATYQTNDWTSEDTQIAAIYGE